MDNLQANDYNQTVSAKVASYVLVAADKGTRITMSNAGATTITVNTSLFTAGDTLFITNIGAGASTITAGTATVSTASSLVLAQYDSGRLYFTSTGVAIWEKYQGAAASTSGMSFIKRASFSAVANTSTTFDGVFTSSYYTYIVVVERFSAATAADDFQMIMRYGGVSETSHYGLSANGGAGWTGTAYGAAAQMTISAQSGTAADSVAGQFQFTGVGNATEKSLMTFLGSDQNSSNILLAYGGPATARLFDGFQLKSSSTNITGTVSVYGLAKS
jgi:hypothetical protein